MPVGWLIGCRDMIVGCGYENERTKNRMFVMGEGGKGGNQRKTGKEEEQLSSTGCNCEGLKVESEG